MLLLAYLDRLEFEMTKTAILPDPDVLLRELWEQHRPNVHTWKQAAGQLLLGRYGQGAARWPERRILSGSDADYERFSKGYYQGKEMPIGSLLAVAQGLVFLQPFNEQPFENIGGMLVPSERRGVLAELRHIPGADATLYIREFVDRRQPTGHGEIAISGTWLGQRTLNLLMKPERWNSLSAWLAYWLTPDTTQPELTDIQRHHAWVAAYGND